MTTLLGSLRPFIRFAGGLLLLAMLPSAPVHGQQIVPDPGGESCQVTPDCKPHDYTFRPGAGQMFLRWQVRGDLRLLSPDIQNPATICSEGYGKGRITAHYYSFRKDDKCRERCPDTVYHTLDYDVFKQFDLREPMQGPACARPGQEVTYSVPPILTDYDHRRAGIGTDGYVWSGFPSGTSLRFSGDSSSVTALLPATLASGFTVEAQVGRCNSRTPLKHGVALDQNLAAAVTGPDCPAPAGGAYLTMRIATLPGTTYVMALPAGWRFANASTGTLTGNGTTQDIYFELGAAPGNVLLTATGGCGGAQTAGWAFTWQP